MRTIATIFCLLLTCSLTSLAAGQTLEYVFNPERSGELTDPMPVGSQNGVRGLSGPFDLDGDGNVEFLAAQHNAAGGRAMLFEVQDTDEWDLVYITPMIDSSASSNNTRYATGGDLDGDGRGEIIFVAGNTYSGDDPTVGVYVFEYDGQGTDNYGSAPATIGNFFVLDPDVNDLEESVNAQHMQVVDIDGDDRNELLLPANGLATGDVFYVLSVAGDFETDQAGTGFETWNIESRLNPRDNAAVYGSGSPMVMVAADMNGDGQMDISYHSWFNLTFFNGTATGADTIELPSENGSFIRGAVQDHTALFGGTAFDIDEDGNDEVFYPNWFTKNITVIDYDDSDDVLATPEEKFSFEAVEIGSAGGIAVGDIDGNGMVELIVGGNGYSASAANAGEPSEFIRIAEYQGGDPKDGSNYVVKVLDTSHPVDTTGFNVIYRDSAGVVSRRFETVLSKQGTTQPDDDPVFVSGIAFLGDADGDGDVEIALSFQGVDDSLQIVDEVWNPDTESYDRSVRETIPAPVRAFVRVYEVPADFGTSVARDELPEGFELRANYPNPFNPSTTLGFTLPGETAISVRVYDMTGRLVKTLVSGRLYTTGTHELTWDGTNQAGARVASGTYFYSLEFEGHRKVRPMVLLK